MKKCIKKECENNSEINSNYCSLHLHKLIKPKEWHVYKSITEYSITLILIFFIVIMLGSLGGMIYETRNFKKNSENFLKDVTALLNNDENYVPACTEFYNPFKIWKSKSEQRNDFKNIKNLCD